VVGVAIRFILDCLEFETRRKRDFKKPLRVGAKNTQRPVQWTPDFVSESKAGRAWRKPCTPI